MTNQESDNAIMQLRQAVIAQKTINLEESPSRQELNNLHTRLRAYDGFVSQLVIAVIQGDSLSTEYEERSAVQRELEQLQAHTDPMVRREVRKYAQYKQRLDTMLELAHTVINQRK